MWVGSLQRSHIRSKLSYLLSLLTRLRILCSHISLPFDSLLGPCKIEERSLAGLRSELVGQKCLFGFKRQMLIGCLLAITPSITTAQHAEIQHEGRTYIDLATVGSKLGMKAYWLSGHKTFRLCSQWTSLTQDMEGMIAAQRTMLTGFTRRPSLSMCPNASNLC